MAKYIPDQHYLGYRGKEYNPTVDSKVPLGFLTPYGTDAAAKKRMGTVDAWCGTNKTTKILDNEPMKGFKISKEVQRWSTSNIVWRIEDPRGFELEISSGNLAYLIGECTIDHGEFLRELQWCRDGADNYLLPVGSTEYEQYIKNSAALKSDVKLRDINPGDIIRIADGTEGKYLGGYYLASFSARSKNNYKLVHVSRRFWIQTARGQVDKSSFKGIQLISKGDPADNKDYSNEINASESLANGSGFYVSKKKPDEQAILNSIRTVPHAPRTESWNKTRTFMVDYKGAIIKVSGYGGRVQMMQLFVDKEHNYLASSGVDGHSRRNMYSYGNDSKKYPEMIILSNEEQLEVLSKIDEAVWLAAQIDGKDYFFEGYI